MPKAAKPLQGFIKKYVDDLLRVPTRAAARHGDDVARGAARHTDDVARGAGRHTDDVARGAGRHGDEAARGGTRRPGFTEDGRINPDDFRTGPDQAHYWSGRTDGNGVMDRAAELAERNGGTTLESLMERRGIELPKWDPDNPAVTKVWDDASAAYANGAQGRVRVVLGEQLRPNNIWQRTEHPRLLRNERVSEIVRVDPRTGQEFPYS